MLKHVLERKYVCVKEREREREWERKRNWKNGLPFFALDCSPVERAIFHAFFLAIHFSPFPIAADVCYIHDNSDLSILSESFQLSRWPIVTCSRNKTCSPVTRDLATILWTVCNRVFFKFVNTSLFKVTCSHYCCYIQPSHTCFHVKEQSTISNKN